METISVSSDLSSLMRVCKTLLALLIISLLGFFDISLSCRVKSVWGAKSCFHFYLHNLPCAEDERVPCEIINLWPLFWVTVRKLQEISFSLLQLYRGRSHSMKSSRDAEHGLHVMSSDRKLVEAESMMIFTTMTVFIWILGTDWFRRCWLTFSNSSAAKNHVFMFMKCFVTVKDKAVTLGMEFFHCGGTVSFCCCCNKY